MADWIRQLIRPSNAVAEWHIARDKGLTTTTYCGKQFEGPIEVASSDQRAERDGRCSTCETRLSEKLAVAGAKAR